MAKLAVVVLLSFVLLFNVAAAKIVVARDEVKWCNKTETFLGGGCGDPEQCVVEFSEKYGNVAAINCVCKAISGNRHTCSCDVICGSVPPPAGI